MAATVLSSQGAVEMSVFVVRAFVQFRTALLSTRELAKRLDALERHMATKKRPIGFTADLDGSE